MPAMSPIAVAVGVREAARVDLVDDGVAPPRRGLREVKSHATTLPGFLTAKESARSVGWCHDVRRPGTLVAYRVVVVLSWLLGLSRPRGRSQGHAWLFSFSVMQVVWVAS